MCSGPSSKGWNIIQIVVFTAASSCFSSSSSSSVLLEVRRVLGGSAAVSSLTVSHSWKSDAQVIYVFSVHLNSSPYLQSERCIVLSLSCVLLTVEGFCNMRLYVVFDLVFNFSFPIDYDVIFY